MNKLKMNRFLPVLLILLLATTDAFAQKKVISGADTAGFVIATEEVSAGSKSTDSEPVIHYQLNVDMLANVDDRLSMSVFPSGLVQVHYPVYMKKAGDYEMQLDESELITLVQSLSTNGVLEFDEKNVKEKIQRVKNTRRAKGEVYVVSDAVEIVVDVKLDEYQKNTKSKKIKNFHKQFKWRNIEQDAKRYKDTAEITGAYESIKHLRSMMRDDRLLKGGSDKK